MRRLPHHPSESKAARARLAPLGALLAVWLVILLPAVHAWMGCGDEGPAPIACAQCDSHDGDPRGTPPHHHHDDSTCELCKHMLVSQHGVTPNYGWTLCTPEPPLIGSMRVSAQRSGGLPAAAARTTRGPPPA